MDSTQNEKIGHLTSQVENLREDVRHAIEIQEALLSAMHVRLAYVERELEHAKTATTTLKWVVAAPVAILTFAWDHHFREGVKTILFMK